MKYDINNKVIEDLLIVFFKNKNISNQYICSDKRNKKSNKKVIPLFWKKENIYAGYEKKVIHYYKNIDKYLAIGIENIEQYIYLILLKQNKLYGKEKKIAMYINEYIHKKNEFNKMGFYSVKDYLNYKKIFNKTKDYKQTNYAISIQKEFNQRKEEFEQYGIFSLDDYKKYNQIIEKAYFVYNKVLSDKIDFMIFLDFELREFKWKKEYFNTYRSLKGVQKYIQNKYCSSNNTLKINNLYFKEPEFYYINRGFLNFSDYFEYKIKLISARNNYKSDNRSFNFSEFLDIEMRKEVNHNYCDAKYEKMFKL